MFFVFERRYQDAMAIVREYGKPDFFITMTCNPNWPEIKDFLLPGQNAQDNPTLVVRVFKLKFKLFRDWVMENWGPQEYFLWVSDCLDVVSDIIGAGYRISGATSKLETLANHVFARGEDCLMLIM